MRTEEILFPYKEEQAGTAYLESEAKILAWILKSSLLTSLLKAQ